MNGLSKFSEISRNINALLDELNEEGMNSYGIEYYLNEAANHVDTARKIFANHYVTDE